MLDARCNWLKNIGRDDHERSRPAENNEARIAIHRTRSLCTDTVAALQDCYHAVDRDLLHAEFLERVSANCSTVCILLHLLIVIVTQVCLLPYLTTRFLARIFSRWLLIRR